VPATAEERRGVMAKRPRSTRSPFRVKRDGPRAWKIVNRFGDSERLGYRERAAASAVCQLMNRAAAEETHDDGD